MAPHYPVRTSLPANPPAASSILEVMASSEAMAHFERLGRAMAETRIVEPRPKDFRELIDRMCAIDSRCGMGTEDPLGGDLPSHLAYLGNRKVLLERSGRRVKCR